MHRSITLPDQVLATGRLLPGMFLVALHLWANEAAAAGAAGAGGAAAGAGAASRVAAAGAAEVAAAAGAGHHSGGWG